MTFRNKRFWIVSLAYLVSIAAGTTHTAAAGEPDHEHLDIQPAATYPFKQTAEGVTIAADVYETGDKVKAAFGKHNPYDYGVLPILVIVENHSDKAIRVDRMDAQYETRGSGRVDATPARELQYLHGARQPRTNQVPLPIPGMGGKAKKNPLSNWEIEGRAFAAKIVPPGERVGGFFYFQTGHRSKSSLILNGITEVGTGRELFYFEVPLAPVQ